MVYCGALWGIVVDKGSPKHQCGEGSFSISNSTFTTSTQTTPTYYVKLQLTLKPNPPPPHPLPPTSTPLVHSYQIVAGGRVARRPPVRSRYLQELYNQGEDPVTFELLF